MLNICRIGGSAHIKTGIADRNHWSVSAIPIWLLPVADVGIRRDGSAGLCYAEITLYGLDLVVGLVDSAVIVGC